MPELNGFSGKKTMDTLIKMGFIFKRIRGSHAVLRRGHNVCIVPMHGELAVGTLRSVLRQASVAPEEFLKNA